MNQVRLVTQVIRLQLSSQALLPFLILSEIQLSLRQLKPVLLILPLFRLLLSFKSIVHVELNKSH